MTNKKLWVFNDAHNWGVRLAQVAQARGYDAHLFDDAREPEKETGGAYVFMHMHHHPQVRAQHKRIMAALALNPHLILIPDYRSSVLYDDKLEQARQFAKWMPRTHVFTTPGATKKFLNNGVRFPLVSKTSEGAGSNNVRMITNMQKATDELRFAFTDIGIKAKHGQEQRGYLLWQEFIPDNPGDIRVLAIGSKRLILRRTNRPDRPMASGSGITKPITVMDAELNDALQFSNSFLSEERLLWCGIDLVKNHTTGKWLMLETTVGWTLHGYYECGFFNKDGTPVKKAGKHVLGEDVWTVLIDEVEAGVFG